MRPVPIAKLQDRAVGGQLREEVDGGCLIAARGVVVPLGGVLAEAHRTARNSSRRDYRLRFRLSVPGRHYPSTCMLGQDRHRQQGMVRDLATPIVIPTPFDELEVNCGRS